MPKLPSPSPLPRELRVGVALLITWLTANLVYALAVLR